MSEDKQVKYTDEDKLRWEVEKLQAETHNLKKSVSQNPLIMDYDFDCDPGSLWCHDSIFQI